MSSQSEHLNVKRRVHHFASFKDNGQKITVVTAYDFPTARAADAAGADAILVGDSLGMVALGLESTIPVTLDIMLHHTAAVRRGATKAFLVADMPFLTFGVSREQTLKNAARLIQESGAEAVKLEGGRAVADTIKAIVDAGIPVLAHIGLLPQSIHQQGGYRVQGRDADLAEKIMDDARAVQDAGAFAVVLEGMPADLSKRITSELKIPTIGIGAGRHCDGQVLVVSDIIGMLPGHQPKFVKKYADVASTMTEAIAAFSEDVRHGRFPDDAHEY